MVIKVPQFPATFDGVVEAQNNAAHRFWGSARMTYTICAFLAMVLQLCMRNSLNFVILCMTKGNLNDVKPSVEKHIENIQCGVQNYQNESSIIERTGDLLWTRSQEFTIQGTFYYGYLITLPIAGILADKFGGKLLFVHSITAQAVVFMLIPIFARLSFAYAVAIRTLQGLIAGLGNPALYQLFSTWAHPTERTALVSFAYGGFAVGSLLIFPISGAFCHIGWDSSFYIVGGISLLCGISFHWLVYNTLEDHPRLSKEEYQYLKVTNEQKSKQSTVPWKSILSSLPVQAFTLTHICHSYGIIVLTMIMPRFLKETMQFSLTEVSAYSSVPFLGAIISKAISVTLFSSIEKRPNLNLTKFKRIVYVLCNLLTILSLLGIIFANCQYRVVVVFLTMLIGLTSDLSFCGGYWPTLLFVAPSYVGLISGMANCLATSSGFLAPYGIAAIVTQGTKLEWNYIILTLMTAYSLGALVFGSFGSAKLQHWDQQSSNRNTIT